MGVAAAKNIGKKPKDQNAPKRTSSGYFLYLKDVRSQVAVEHPNAAITQIGKIIGAMWRELNDEQKAVYVTKAEDLKIEYQRAVQAYQKTEEYAQYTEKLNAWKQAVKDNKKAAKQTEMSVEPATKKIVALRKK